MTTPPSKGLVVELYLIYFGLAQSFVDDSSIEWAVVSVRVISVLRSTETCLILWFGWVRVLSHLTPPSMPPPPIPKAQNTSASFSNTESSSQLIPKWKSDCLPWHTLVHNGSVCRVRWLRFKHETALPTPLTPPQFAGKGKCKSAKCSVTQPSLVKAPLCYLRALIINSLLSVEKKAL